MNHRLLIFKVAIMVYYFFIMVPAIASKNYPPITFKANFLKWNPHSSFLYGEEKATLTYQDMKVVADKIEANLNSLEFQAQGNIFLKVKGYEVRGESLWFSLKKGKGTLTLPWGENGPIIFKAKKAQFSSATITLEDGQFTTCDLSPPHYRIKAKQIQIIPKEKITARNATLYIGSIPVFWIPLFIRYLSEGKGIRRNRMIFPRFGYNDFTGWHIKTGYQFYISPSLGGIFHLDYLSKCGWAEGIDLFHQSGRANASLESYYIKERNSKIERGMGRLRYWQALSNFSCVKLKLDYFTDKEFLGDYFPKIAPEKKQILPSSLSFDSWGENRNFRFLLQPKINPFPQEWEEMLPQIKFNLLPQKIGRSNFYVQETTQITNFKEKDKNLMRTESSVDISHPFILFNYLQFKPRFGWHLSYSQKEKEKPKYFSVNYQNYDFFLKLKGRLGKFSHQISPHLTYYHSNRSNMDEYPKDFLELKLNNDFYFEQKKIINAKLKLGYDLTKRREKFTPIETNVSFNNYLNMDLVYEPYQKIFKLIRTNLDVRRKNWRLNLGFRKYADDVNVAQLFSEVGLNLDKKWRISGYTTYDIKKREVKEIGYSIWRDLHCWAAQLSIREKPEKDYSIIFYIKAFPQFKVGSF